MDDAREDLIDGVSAILLISPDAKALAGFYSQILGVPLRDEVHEGVPLHFACELGSVHFAIHPADDWPGTQVAEPRSPVIALSTHNAAEVAERLQQAGITPNGPFDRGFALVVSFRDPDGNHVEVLEPSNA